MFSRRFTAVAAVVVIGCSSAQAQSASRVSFSRVTTEPGLGRLDFVLAVADLNGDGRDDIVAGGREEFSFDGAREDRFEKTTLHVFAGEENGSLTPVPELVEGAIEARSAIVVAADFNGDTRADLAIFDEGVYVGEESSGYGNPPQLFLSSPDGRLRPSDALADAVAREHELRPHPHYSGPADLHLKSATAGDIDGDGDVDLWVDSIGGANVSSHFMVNNGDGTFTVDEARAPAALRHNPPESWYHLEGHLADLDNDGDLDLALGQNRDIFPSTVNQFSVVLINDGAGNYPARIELPRPAFNDGYTSVKGQAHFDVNGDGFQDLLVVHTRNDDGPPDVIPWTGRHIQVLVNRGTPSPVLRRRGPMSFGDETSTWMGDQSAAAPQRNADGEELANYAAPKMHDVDRDGCADLVMSGSLEEVGTDAPLVYRNNGSGQFVAMPPEPFGGSDDTHVGLYAVPADVNGDAVIDFVVPRRHDGPDGRPRTGDDFGTLVTLVNTTPVGPVRCG